jgi:hypothetical protein
MTTHGPCIVVTLLGYLLAGAASAHADSAWMLWQQATVFTERWWIPKGWPGHWKASELIPVGLAEFPTLADCQLAQTQSTHPRRPTSRRRRSPWPHQSSGKSATPAAATTCTAMG